MGEPTDDDPAVDVKFPGIAKVGDRIRIAVGPLAGESVIIRRQLTGRGGVLFAMRYPDGKILEHEWFD
jgi:hypothetical protein